MNKKPIVSLVISTRNEEKSIGKCLESVEKQTYPRDCIEVIVVDNNSEDKTKEIAYRYTDKVYNKGPERSAQRNNGLIEKASGKYGMFIDADMVLSKGLVEECVAKMESRKTLVGLYIPLRWRGDNWIIRAKGFERTFYDATCLDAVRFIRLDIFKKIGGFDLGLYAAEDWDLDRRLREQGDVGSVKSKMYHDEEEDLGFFEYVGKMRYYSGNLKKYIEKWGEYDPEVRKQLSFSSRLRFFVQDGNWRRLALHPVLSFQLFIVKIASWLVFIFAKKDS